ncbi:MAG: DUF3631 domain-containing protein [Alphaproteobacteria bacterium]|nr:DUF3631 domain-containing protein [Alphaproteobacteria bacterium]
MLVPTEGAQPIRDAIDAAMPVLETQEQAIARLALLSPLDYDRVREAEAEKLGVRTSTLDKEVGKARNGEIGTEGMGALFQTLDPWPESIDPNSLLNDIESLIRFYIVCSTETAIATALWIAFTWFIDHVQVAPIAMITAPEKRCGKSQLLSLICKLSSRPLQASNISPAAIFRVIEAYAPTLLIDEADAFMKDNEEIRCVINSGHTRQSAQVIRLVGDNHEPKQFSTWGAKAISGIGSLPDTIMDRSIVLELRRKLEHEKVERLRYAEPLQFEVFKRQLYRFAIDTGDAIAHARPALPEKLNDRAQDNWEPLLAIADYAGGEWPQRARDAALKISGSEHDALSLSTELLADIRDVLADKCQWYPHITTKALLEALIADDLKPWATYNRGKSMSPRQLAKRLGEYGIKSKNLCIGHARPKGYEKAQFEDVFARYLYASHEGGDLSATSAQLGSNPLSEPISSVADQTLRSGNKNASATPKPAEISQSSGVADKIPLSEDEEERLAIQQFDGGAYAA